MGYVPYLRLPAGEFPAEPSCRLGGGTVVDRGVNALDIGADQLRQKPGERRLLQYWQCGRR